MAKTSKSSRTNKRARKLDGPSVPEASIDERVNELISLGCAEYCAGNYEASIKHFSAAVELDEHSATAFDWRGCARRELHELDDALKDLNRAIELNPQESLYYINRAWVRLELEDTSGTIEDCDKALSLGSHDAAAFINRGVARARQGDFAGAIVDYDEALQISPSHDLAYNNRGLARFKLGEVAGAIRDYCEALRINPSHPFARHNLDDALLALELKTATVDCSASVVWIGKGLEFVGTSTRGNKVEIRDSEGLFQINLSESPAGHPNVVMTSNSGPVALKVGPGEEDGRLIVELFDKNRGPSICVGYASQPGEAAVTIQAGGSKIVTVSVANGIPKISFAKGNGGCQLEFGEQT